MCDFSVFADHPARFDHRRDFTIIERSVKMNRGKKEDSRDYFIKYRVSKEELDAINKKF